LKTTYNGTWFFRNKTWPSKLVASLAAITSVIKSTSRWTSGILRVGVSCIWCGVAANGGGRAIEEDFSIDEAWRLDITGNKREGGGDRDGANKGIELFVGRT
jgi:hypothetical protein